jgi:Protein of unknown function (DUF664).
MKPFIPSLLRSWANQRDYAQKLVADLSDEDMVSQPVPGVVMNHPAWTLGHLAAYPPVLTAMLLGQPFTDPMHSPYGRGSMPKESGYPPKAQLLAEFLDGHDRLAAAVEAAPESAWSAPIPLARWEQRFPEVADAVIYLMLSHEATHLGQISAWRRAGGRPAV